MFVCIFYSNLPPKKNLETLRKDSFGVAKSLVSAMMPSQLRSVKREYHLRVHITKVVVFSKIVMTEMKH